MNTLKNTGYGTQNESSGRVSIGVLFAMPTSGSFIMPKIINYEHGEKIGECIFLREVKRTNKQRRGLFKCLKCDDGNEFESNICYVKNRNTQSCGCYNKEVITTHGMSKDKLYGNWHDRKSRCENPNSDSYNLYGGRGITMCDEWRNDFKAFHDYVTQLPDYGKKGYTLDREDNDGNYEPRNVRWASKHTQVANRRMPKNNKSGYIGVFWSKVPRKFIALITVNKKSFHIGSFDCPIEAVGARNDYIIDNNLTEYPIQET